MELRSVDFFKATLEEGCRLIGRTFFTECEDKEFSRRGALDRVAVDGGVKKFLPDQEIRGLDQSVIAVGEEFRPLFQWLEDFPGFSALAGKKRKQSRKSERSGKAE